jgi:hypothetical protein
MRGALCARAGQRTDPCATVRPALERSGFVIAIFCGMFEACLIGGEIVIANCAIPPPTTSGGHALTIAPVIVPRGPGQSRPTPSGAITNGDTILQRTAARDRSRRRYCVRHASDRAGQRPASAQGRCRRAPGSSSPARCCAAPTPRPRRPSRPDDRQLKAQGITTVADAIRSLSADNSGSIPAAFGSGFAAGSTGVSLRGLSVNSTLVMIDGLRNANYPLADDGQKAFVDLNSIPFNAVSASRP